MDSEKYIVSIASQQMATKSCSTVSVHGLTLKGQLLNMYSIIFEISVVLRNQKDTIETKDLKSHFRKITLAAVL